MSPLGEGRWGKEQALLGQTQLKVRPGGEVQTNYKQITFLSRLTGAESLIII